MECRLGAAPEHDLHFVEQSARRHADRKRVGSRSSGQPALRTRPAVGPLATRPICRCDTSTRLCAVPSSTNSSVSPMFAASAPSAINSHSSGPSHKAARPLTSLAAPSCDGGSAPNAIPHATRTASRPRRMKRAAGGPSDKANRGPAGKAKPPAASGVSAPRQPLSRAPLCHRRQGPPPSRRSPRPASAHGASRPSASAPRRRARARSDGPESRSCRTT